MLDSLVKENNKEKAKVQKDFLTENAKKEGIVVTPSGLDIYSGNDDVVVPVLSVGGKGVISVLANILPLETHTMVAEFLNGNVETARKIQIKYKHLIDILFMEPNPIPVKAALELMGYKVGKLRLPLTKASNETVLKLKEEMRNLKII